MNINKKFKNSFFRSIILLTSGTAFAQLLNTLLAPLITRIYTPEEYGVLTLYISIVTVISIGASLDYQKAIPLVKTRSSAYNLIFLSCVILFSITIILLLVIAIWGQYIFGYLNIDTLTTYKYLIPIGVFFIGTYNIFLHWSLRTKDFKRISITKVNQSIASNFTQICLGLLNIGPIGLITGNIIGQSAGVTKLSLPVFNNRKNFIKVIKYTKIKKLAKSFINFPLYSSPSNYVYTAGNQAPIVVLAVMFGATVSGLYGLANIIVNLPISLLATSVSQVFYSEIASIGKSNPKKIRNLSMSLFLKLALVGLVPLIIFIVMGPWLFATVFGELWYEAGVYSQIIAFIAYIHFIILPSGRILEILGKQNIALILNVIRLILILFTFYLSSVFNFNSYQTIISYAIASSLSYILLFFFTHFILIKEEKYID